MSQITGILIATNRWWPLFYYGIGWWGHKGDIDGTIENCQHMVNAAYGMAGPCNFVFYYSSIQQPSPKNCRECMPRWSQNLSFFARVMESGETEEKAKIM